MSFTNAIVNGTKKLLRDGLNYVKVGTDYKPQTGTDCGNGKYAGDQVVYVKNSDGSYSEWDGNIGGKPLPKDVVFHDAVTANEAGAIIDVTGYKTLGIEVIRTSVTANTLTFNSGIENTQLFQDMAVLINSDATVSLLATGTSTTSKFVTMDVSAKKYVQIPLTGLTGTGATVTVKGHLE